MATKTQYAKLTIHLNREGLRARITTDHGIVERPLKASRYPQPGWVLRKALRWAFDLGWGTQSGSTDWYIRDGVQTRNLEREAELCPNGQSAPECTEIDPCELCYQDEQEEGDMIEASMGLR